MIAFSCSGYFKPGNDRAYATATMQKITDCKSILFEATPSGTISTAGNHNHSFNGTTITEAAYTHTIAGFTGNGLDYLPSYITVYAWYREA